MAESKLSKYEQVQAERVEKVRAAIAAQEARDELRAAAKQGEKDYAATIARIVKEGVPIDDLKLAGVDIPEEMPKRVSKQRRPLEVPEGREPKPSGWATVGPDGKRLDSQES